MGSAIAVNAAGEVYVGGQFQGTCDFDPGPGVLNITAVGGNDFYLAKFTTTGNLVWIKTIGSTGTDICNAVMVDATGNICLTGYFNGTADFDPGPGVINLSSSGGNDVFVTKFDPSGNLIWAKSIGGLSNESASSLITDPAGNIYCTGYFQGTCDFDPGSGVYNLSSSGGSDIFVLKLDPSGNLIWAKAMSGANDEFGNSLDIDGSSNVYVTGRFVGTVDFDPGSGSYNLSTPSVNRTDIFISKLDASGNFVWAKSITQPAPYYSKSGNSIKSDGANGVYITGHFGGVVDFDPGSGVANLTAMGNSDGFVAKFDGAGNFIWAHRIGNPVLNGSLVTTGTYITLNSSGEIFGTGSLDGSSDFDPTSGVYNLTSAGQVDVYIFKWTQCTIVPAQPGNISGNSSICPGTSQTYSISSVTGATSYSWILPAGWTGSSTTTSITATAGSTGTISVAANNTCGSSTPQTISVTVNPPPTPTITQSGNLLNAPGGFASYQWHLNINPIPGATNQSHIATQSGNYYVVVTNSNNCTGQSNTLNVVVTDVENVVKEQKLMITPNPVSSAFTVYGQNSIGLICIFDPLGRKVFERNISERKAEIDLRQFPVGLYYMRSVHSNGIIRLMKE